MNVFPSRADGAAAAARVQVGTQRIPIAPAATDVLAQVRAAGVRPEAIALARTAADGGALQATVEHLESLGHETLAHVRVDDVRLVARLEGMHRFAPGETVTLRIDPTRVYLFADDGTRLATGRPAA
jgi:ABC-type sugar transport system ATPase subunit